ncbi:hypothetical protein PENTCL1PPCAC_8444, partial [Pristionchus entomophagus]
MTAAFFIYPPAIPFGAPFCRYGSRLRLRAESLTSQTCKACGERADGVHFGAVVCAACGAFFRRSVVDQRVYSCTGCASGSTPSTSRGWLRERDERATARMPGICRYCRFQRCLAVGMKPEEVQAKRVSGSGRLRPLKFVPAFCTSSAFEDLVSRRREMARMRPTPPAETVSFTVEDIRKSMESEYNLFYTLIMQSPIMVELLNDASPIPSPDAILVLERSAHHRDTIRELFLFSFLFETVRSTAIQGGIQSDSVTLPTGVRLPLEHEPLEKLYATDAEIADPGCLARLSNDFLFSVTRVVARSLQALHADQNELAWLYAIFVSSAVIPVGRRSAFRDELLASVCLPDDHSIERQGQLLLLLTPMMVSLDHLRQFLQVADLAGAALTKN